MKRPVPPIRVGSSDDTVRGVDDGPRGTLAGWKVNRLVVDDFGRVAFAPLTGRPGSRNAWQPEAVAECLAATKHGTPVPEPACKCGLYVLRERFEAEALLNSSLRSSSPRKRDALPDGCVRPSWWTPPVLLEVSPHGRLLVFDRGWRAQMLTVTGVWVPRACAFCPQGATPDEMLLVSAGVTLTPVCAAHAGSFALTMTLGELAGKLSSVTGGCDVSWLEVGASGVTSRPEDVLTVAGRLASDTPHLAGEWLLSLDDEQFDVLESSGRLHDVLVAAVAAGCENVGAQLLAAGDISRVPRWLDALERVAVSVDRASVVRAASSVPSSVPF